MDFTKVSDAVVLLTRKAYCDKTCTVATAITAKAMIHKFCPRYVKPEQIIIGAGTEYLYGLIIQLFGQNKTYAVEDPGYQKIRFSCNIEHT